MHQALGNWNRMAAGSGCAAAILGAWLCLVGCTPGGSLASEENDPNVQAGMIQRRSGFHTEAEEAFQRALQNNPKSATAHYELGLLYYESMTNYASALHHFERFRRLRVRPANEDVLKLMIIECKRELAKDVPLGSIGLQQQREIQRLRDTNAVLLLELEKVRQQLAARAAPAPEPLQQEAARTPATNPAPPRATTADVAPVQRQGPTPAVSNPANAPRTAARTHIVRPGETMAAIARRYQVGLPALLAANPGVDPRRLQPGQSVAVPGP